MLHGTASGRSANWRTLVFWNTRSTRVQKNLSRAMHRQHLDGGDNVDNHNVTKGVYSLKGCSAFLQLAYGLSNRSQESLSGPWQTRQGKASMGVFWDVSLGAIFHSCPHFTFAFSGMFWRVCYKVQLVSCQIVTPLFPFEMAIQKVRLSHFS